MRSTMWVWAAAAATVAIAQSALAQEPAECQAEETISDVIRESHRPVFHGINEASAVHEIGQTLTICLVKSTQKFRRHREVCVKDCQKLAARMDTTKTNGIDFSFACLLKRLQVEFGRIRRHNPRDLLPRPIAGVAFDEDDFGIAA